MSAALGTEKYRIFWMQNMLWSNIKLLSWLEKEYGAVVVMEAFGYQKGPVFENPDDLDRIFYDLARKTLALPMIHGASGPIENYLEVSEQIIKDYQVDLAMFVGHVSCKHTWAVSKLVKDMVREKFDLPTLTIDVDAIDSRYKKPEETQAIISEFMETLA
jgi:benzoyl-CoA reductase/2-hydroxyglutaryl-CoA dehydratase subunit BcrC/BadD/HgdB